MFVIDTNIHAAYLLQNYENDALTKKYLSFYSRIPLSQRVLPDFILNEFEIFIFQVAPYKYKLTTEQREKFQVAVFEYINEVSRSYMFAVPSIEAYKKALDIYEQNIEKRYVSFTDSLIIALAQDSGYSIFTKDNRIQELARDLNVAFYST